MADEDEELKRFELEIKKAEEESERLKREKRMKKGKKNYGTDGGEDPGSSGMPLATAFENEIEIETALVIEEETAPSNSKEVNDSNNEENDEETNEEKEFYDDDGTLYKWNEALKVWVPQNDASVTIPEYSFDVMTFEREEEMIPSFESAIKEREEEIRRQEMLTEEEAMDTIEGRKRKKPMVEGDEEKGRNYEDFLKSSKIDEVTGIEKKEKKQDRGITEDEKNERMKKKAELLKLQEVNSWFELKVNTSVYVQNLPLDVTLEEVEEVFSKCGIIKEDPDLKRPKIKLYKDKKTGLLKGDGLVTYLKDASVQLAIKILDNTPLRLGDSLLMKISVAKFEQKGEVFIKKEVDKTKKKKIKIKEQKSLGWGGFDDSKQLNPTSVVLKGMFTLDELASDPNFLAELNEDVLQECQKFGPVERIKIYDNHPDGVVLVRYKDKSHASKCIEVMNGRWFAARRIEALLDDGQVNYAAYRDETYEIARLEKFASELEWD